MMRVWLIIGLFMLVYQVQAIVIGSNTVVSIQGNVVFPAGDVDNEIRGFAYMQSGFSLQNNVTTCLYNAFFPVNGPVNLNNGTLTLNRDLFLSSGSTLGTGGVISGGNRALVLPDSQTAYAISNPITINNATITLRSNVVLTSTVTLGGTCYIDGNGYTIDCTMGALVVAANANVTLAHLTLDGVAATNVSCAASTSILTLTDLTWIQGADYTFSQGSMRWQEKVLVKGGHTFTYSTGVQGTIMSYAELVFEEGTTFSYTASLKDRLAFEDETAHLHLIKATLHSGTPGIRLTKGTGIIEGQCYFESDAAMQSDALELGDGISSANNFTLVECAASGVTLGSGFLVYNNLP
ncbi:MAG: hypothetical protein WBQ73_00780 [Candidatus Babeliales bacterium]